MNKIKKYAADGALAMGMLALLASALQFTASAGSPGAGCGATCTKNADCTSPDCPSCSFDVDGASGTCKG